MCYTYLPTRKLIPQYLTQKLFEYCNDAQRLALVERCAPSIPLVSTNMHGTRAVQRMIECLSTPEQVRAVCNSLSPAAVSLMKDINGNHCIQRCLHRLEPADNQFVANNCFELATHRHGCCVMQRCMDYASPSQRDQLAMQINANALPLVQNPYGNYVVQYVLELNEPAYTAEIIRRLRGHFAELSMQKFSSNVVEKSLQLADRDTRRDLIHELISNQDTMRQLLHDPYGNYCVQRALQVAESPQLEQMCEAIKPHLNALKQSPYGKRIQAKILKRMPNRVSPPMLQDQQLSSLVVGDQQHQQHVQHLQHLQRTSMLQGHHLQQMQTHHDLQQMRLQVQEQQHQHQYQLQHQGQQRHQQHQEHQYQHQLQQQDQHHHQRHLQHQQQQQHQQSQQQLQLEQYNLEPHHSLGPPSI
jgi:hypothetical protein